MRSYSTPIAHSLRLTRLLFGVGIGVHLLFLLSLHFGWLNGLFNDSMHRFGPGADFFSIYAAGVKARQGASLYTLGGLADNIPYAYSYRYAPIVAYTLGWALSLLPALTAYGVWLIVCEWTLLRNVRLTFEHAPDKPTAYLAASLWLLFTPYYLELYVGQFTFVTASLVFWAYLAWSEKPVRTGRSPISHWLGDGLFGLSVWLKMMPLLYLPIALLRGRWKSAVGTVLVLVASSWLYFARHPHDWRTFKLMNGDPFPTWHAGNQGLMALAYDLTQEHPVDFLWLYRTVLIFVGGVLAWLYWRAWQARRQETRSDNPDAAASPTGSRFEENLLLFYAAASAAYLLVYKDVWEHHYVLLLPPLVLMALRKYPVAVWLPAFLIAAAPTLFALYDAHGLGFNEEPQGYWRQDVLLLHHGWKPISALWLMGGILWQSVRAFRVRHKEIFEKKIVAQQEWTVPLRKYLSVGLFVLLLGGGTVVFLWARTAILEQRKGVVPHVWSAAVFRPQRHNNTCGPAALAAVCRYYGIAADEDEIAQMAGTQETGTSMLGMQQAAQQKGLVAFGRRVSSAELKRTPLPCILFYHPGHFAVLTGIRQDRLYIADPSLGQQVWTSAQLLRTWRGELLVVGPAEKLP